MPRFLLRALVPLLLCALLAGTTAACDGDDKDSGATPTSTAERQ
ncbi:hypothetical protein [Streptomyces sp. LNU-CPARS28]